MLRPVLSAFAAAALGCLLAAAPLHAQELATQPTPFTALLDFALLRHPFAPKPPLPIWLESVQILPAETAAASVPADPDAIQGLPEEKPAPHTVFRIRLRPLPGITERFLLRLYFDDRPDTHPTVTAWTETGDCRFRSEPLGAGLRLPVSESLAISPNGADYLEIDVPGDGTTLRKAFLSPLKKSVQHTPFDFAPAPASAEPVADPFGALASPSPGENDTYLFGRVRATLEPDIVKLDAANGAVSYQFELESAPLLSLVTLELLNADPLTPIQVSVNDTETGSIIAHFPDLADPAYIGESAPLQSMRFRYAGWLRAQAVIPGSALRSGTNTVTFQLPAGSSPAAIRAVELQLKNPWKGLDYLLAPAR